MDANIGKCGRGCIYWGNDHCFLNDPQAKFGLFCERYTPHIKISGGQKEENDKKPKKCDENCALYRGKDGVHYRCALPDCAFSAIPGADCYAYTTEEELKKGDTVIRCIIRKCNDIANMLCEKNRKYGNSALEPCRIFSRANAYEQLLVRLDDKLSRLKNRQNDEDEDVLMDIAGYMILLLIAREKCQ